MKRTNKIILAGLLAGSLVLPSITVTANADEGHENHGQHKGWEKQHGKKFDHSEHDRRDLHRNDRWDDHHRRDVRHAIRHDRRHDGRIDNRGHHNKPEIRKDFKDIRNARNEVKQDRVDLRKDYTELSKDRAELRKDIRNGASKTEIAGDRRELREDLAKISKDRAELRKDQTTLNTARQELKNDLRKR